MTADLLLGIDGGGTKTTALLADLTGQVLGRGRAGSSNAKAVGEAGAQAAVQTAIAQAYAAAGLVFTLPRGACLGLSGVDTPADHARHLAWAERTWPGVPVAIVNDVELAAAAGTPEGWGIAVIAGTGAIVYGQTRAGDSVRVGGWGWALGDEGSGFAMGLAALRAVTRAADQRGPSTALTEAILAHWALAGPERLLDVVYRTPFPRAEIASLAPLVEAAAADGDEAALIITHEAGRELALAAITAARALQFTTPVPTALAGGVLVHGRGVRRAFTAALEAAEFEFRPVQLVAEPAQGAIVLARRMSGALR